MRRPIMLPIVAPAMRAGVPVERPWWLLVAAGEGEAVAVVELAVVEVVAFFRMRFARSGWVQEWG